MAEFFLPAINATVFSVPPQIFEPSTVQKLINPIVKFRDHLDTQSLPIFMGGLAQFIFSRELFGTKMQ